MKELNGEGSDLRPGTTETVTSLPLDPETDFDRTTALTPVPGRRPTPEQRTGEFDVVFDPGWASLIGVHGGSMAAMAARGAEVVASGRGVRTATTTFLRAGQLGPARLRVTETRRSRSLSTVEAELRQDDAVVNVTRLTLTEARTGVEWSEPGRIVLPSVEECEAIDPPGGVAHFAMAEGRLDPVSIPFTGGDAALVQGYVRPLEGRAVDAIWLTMATDWFPPPAFVRVAPPMGGISIDLTTHVHQPWTDLDGGWLAARFEIRTSTGGFATEHGRIERLDGTLVAESFQTRWTAER